MYSRDLYMVHCIAHRLNLAVSHALKQRIKFFETLINGIITFFTNKSTKRRDSLINLSELYGETFYQIKRIFETRWSSSELMSLSSIIRNYHNMFEVFIHIQVDHKNFDHDFRQRAFSYSRLFADMKFHIFLSFVSDLLDIVSDFSREVQLKSGVLIGQQERTKNLSMN